MAKLRPESSSSLILKALLELHALKSEFTLWQNAGPCRNIHKVTIDHLILNKKKIIVKLKASSYALEIDQALPLYFYCDSPPCVFKTEHFIINETDISLSYPEEVYLNENRFFQRQQIENNSTILAHIKSGNKLEGQKVLFDLIDYSTKGFGILAKKENHKFFYEGDHLVFTNLNKTQLSKAIIGRITYLNQEDNVEGIRIGIEFDEELNEAGQKEIERIIKR